MFIFILIAATFSFDALAKKPLYELGVLTGVGEISDYPASNQSRLRTITLPSFRYRGDIFRNDRKGTRARFIRGKEYSIDLSFGASFPANSKDNTARTNMEDLDWLGEIGPRLNIDLLKRDNTEIEFEFPLRYVFSTVHERISKHNISPVPQLDYTFSMMFSMMGTLKNMTE